jgi:alpha-beta hydrolase superfamily lysophospholipase
MHYFGHEGRCYFLSYTRLLSKRASQLIIFLILSSAIAAASAQTGVFLDGRWEGSIDLGEGPEPLVLRLFPADPETGRAAGGLVDLPARKLFGYPMESLERDPEGLSFAFLGGAPFGGVFELIGSPISVDEGESFAASGAVRILPAAGGGAVDAPVEGRFFLSYFGVDSRGARLGGDYTVDTGRGILPGSILLPETAPDEPVPVVLLLSGAAADRDGNNYSVPGRSDALAELALGLRDRGIASMRFDKRGTGEAFGLAANEEELRFEDHAEDARAAISQLALDPRFSGVTIVGYGEGALVGATSLMSSAQPEGATQPGDAALPEGAAEPADVTQPEGAAADRVTGIVALCASGRSELEMIEKNLSSTPEEFKAEADAIMTALKNGESYPDPSPYFADYFRPSIQPYLASLFRFDPRADFAAAAYPALVIAGGSDLQVPSNETELLAAARPDAAYRVVPGMSHALKGVGDDEEANYASFTDPSLPLAEGLVDLIAAFVKGETLPGEDPR